MVTDGKKCFRITFSKSLAQYIVTGTDMWVEKIRIHLTTELDGKSSNGLYAVCKKDSLWPLRITMFEEMANMWKNDSTVVYGCYIERCY